MEAHAKTLIGDKNLDLRKSIYNIPLWLINQNKHFIRQMDWYSNSEETGIENSQKSNCKNDNFIMKENFLIIGNSNNNELENLIETINLSKMEEEKNEINKLFTQLAKNNNNSFQKSQIRRNPHTISGNFNSNNNFRNSSKSNSFCSDLSLNDSLVEASGLKRYIGRKRQPEEFASFNSEENYMECNNLNASKNLNSSIPNNKEKFNNSNNQFNYNIDQFPKNGYQLNQQTWVGNKLPLNNIVNNSKNNSFDNDACSRNRDALKNSGKTTTTNSCNNPMENIAHILQSLNNNNSNPKPLYSTYVNPLIEQGKEIKEKLDLTKSPLVNNNIFLQKETSPVNNQIMINNNNNFYHYPHSQSYLHPNNSGINPSIPIPNISNNTHFNYNKNFSHPNIKNQNRQYANINSYDNMLENLSDDDEDKTKSKPRNPDINNQKNKNLNLITPKIEEVYNKKISYMNPNEIKELNKVVGDGRELRKMLKEEKMKLALLTNLAQKAEVAPQINKEELEISSIKENTEIEDGEVLFLNSSNIFADPLEKGSEKLGNINRLIPEVQENIKDTCFLISNPSNIIKPHNITETKIQNKEIQEKQIKNLEESKNSQINSFNTTGVNRLSNLLISKKSKVLFKLLYKDNELQVELNILFKSIEKSVMKIDYFLTNCEFLDLRMSHFDYQLCGKLEITKSNITDEDTKLFIDQMGETKVALTEDTEEYYFLICTNNKTILGSFEFSSMHSANIKERTDLILIVKISNETVKENIRNIIKDTPSNKNRVTLSISENSYSSSQTKKEENAVIENKLRELNKEIEELRYFKNKTREITEELLKKKETEVKYKYKLYYDKIIENESERANLSEKKKEELRSDNFKLNKELQESFAELEKLQIEILKHINEICVLKEKIEILEKDKENAIKNEKLSAISFSDAIRDLKETQKRLQEAEAKLAEKEKLIKKLSNDNPLVKIDDFIIQEVPNQHPPVHNEFTDKVFELQSRIEGFMCIICFSKTRDCLFTECNHLSCCFDCIREKIFPKNKKKKNKEGEKENIIKGLVTCPICKKNNYTFLRIYLS